MAPGIGQSSRGSGFCPSIKIEVRKGNLLSNGTAGSSTRAAPSPAGEDRNPKGKPGSSSSTLAGINPTEELGLSAEQDQLCPDQSHDPGQGRVATAPCSPHDALQHIHGGTGSGCPRMSKWNPNTGLELGLTPSLCPHITQSLLGWLQGAQPTLGPPGRAQPCAPAVGAH